jgi:hypothetical protein
MLAPSNSKLKYVKAYWIDIEELLDQSALIRAFAGTVIDIVDPDTHDHTVEAVVVAAPDEMATTGVREIAAVGDDTRTVPSANRIPFLNVGNPVWVYLPDRIALVSLPRLLIWIWSTRGIEAVSVLASWAWTKEARRTRR